MVLSLEAASVVLLTGMVAEEVGVRVVVEFVVFARARGVVVRRARRLGRRSWENRMLLLFREEM